MWPRFGHGPAMWAIPVSEARTLCRPNAADPGVSPTGGQVPCKPLRTCVGLRRRHGDACPERVSMKVVSDCGTPAMVQRREDAAPIWSKVQDATHKLVDF